MGDFEPKVAEATAFREALSWVKSKGLVKVVFVLDSLLVVQAIRVKGKDSSYFDSFRLSVSIHFFSRSSNMATHTMLAISMSDRKEWNSIPSFISNVIAQDLRFLNFQKKKKL